MYAVYIHVYIYILFQRGYFEVLHPLYITLLYMCQLLMYSCALCVGTGSDDPLVRQPQTVDDLEDLTGELGDEELLATRQARSRAYRQQASPSEVSVNKEKVLYLYIYIYT